MSEMRVGIVGLGFMGQTHLTALNSAIASGMACRLTAVCDRHPERRSGEPNAIGNLDTVASERLFNPADVHGFTTPEELFACRDVDAVSICTHTDTHVDLACAALESGKHVMVEKPVALNPDDIDRVSAAAQAAGRVCMPAMVMRFWPGWRWLKETIAAQTYGSVRNATFRRIGTAPSWASEFYENAEISGGALVDLHIHDSDFVRWCFGDPRAVTTSGTLDHASTVYHYDDGPSLVTAEGGWMRQPSCAFQMQYHVTFDDAVARFDIQRDVPLEVFTGDACTPVSVEGPDGYESEMRHFIETAIAGGTPDATLADASAVARLLHAERTSLDSGETRSL